MPDFVDPKRFEHLRVEIAEWGWDRATDSPLIEITFSNGDQMRFRAADDELKLALDRDIHIAPVSPDDEDDDFNAEKFQRLIAEGRLIPEPGNKRDPEAHES